MKSEVIRESVTDAHLPQLRELMDASAMRGHFEWALVRAACLAATQEITDCRIVYVRYRPGNSCTVSYLLAVADAQTGVNQLCRISLLACRPGESRAAMVSALSHSADAINPGAGLIHLPDLEAVAWVFPNDRKLMGLAALTDSEHLRNRLLPEVIRGSFGEEWRITDVTSEVVSFVAERACTMRVKVALSDSSTGRKDTRILYGKTYRADEGDKAWQCQQRLWRSEAVSRGQLLMPQPLLYQPEIKTLWQGGLEGKALIEYEDRPEHLYSLLGQAGATVAALHRTRLPGLHRITIADVVASLTNAEELLSQARPSCCDRLHSLAGRLISSAESIGNGQSATLHGDLHLKNFLATGDGVALIDLDNLAEGDPSQDVGSFVAALHYRGLIRDVPFRATEQTARQFVMAWRAGVGDEMPDAALNWHIAAALIYERAYRCVIRLVAERLSIIDDIISLAELFASRI
ncbi:MAG TPA: phosphotransferase [Blastocatellia bacterium]|nr:phosphotransferase [Blastocatellia bacterium]